MTRRQGHPLQGTATWEGPLSCKRVWCGRKDRPHLDPNDVIDTPQHHLSQKLHPVARTQGVAGLGRVAGLVGSMAAEDRACGSRGPESLRSSRSPLWTAGLRFHSTRSGKPPFGTGARRLEKGAGYIIPDNCSGPRGLHQSSALHDSSPPAPLTSLQTHPAPGLP